MSRPSHSPGPWTALKYDASDYWWIMDAEGGRVAYDVHGQADARLIAAAPELLELLTVALETQAAGTFAWYDRTRALIARITGEAPL